MERHYEVGGPAGVTGKEVEMDTNTGFGLVLSLGIHCFLSWSLVPIPHDSAACSGTSVGRKDGVAAKDSHRCGQLAIN